MKDREDVELSLSFSQAWMYSHTVLGFIGERGERKIGYWGSLCTHPEGRLQSFYVFLPNFLVDVFKKNIGNAKVTQNNLTSYFSQTVICNVTGILFNGNSDVI